MFSKAMFSNARFSKSDIAMIVALLACATATMIEAHNRILIGPPAQVERLQVERLQMERLNAALTPFDARTEPSLEPTLHPDLLAP